MPKDESNFLCSNPSCGKTFVIPLKARNLSLKNTEPFEACPYCLTEITIGKPNDAVERSRPEITKITAKPATEAVPKQRPTPLSSGPKIEGCTRHLGYLSQRLPKEKIPEECMMCDKIVQCMLQTVTG